jgi:hypothetical protein
MPFRDVREFLDALRKHGEMSSFGELRKRGAA